MEMKLSISSSKEKMYTLTYSNYFSQTQLPISACWRSAEILQFRKEYNEEIGKWYNTGSHKTSQIKYYNGSFRVGDRSVEKEN